MCRSFRPYMYFYLMRVAPDYQRQLSFSLRKMSYDPKKERSGARAKIKRSGRAKGFASTKEARPIGVGVIFNNIGGDGVKPRHREFWFTQQQS
ncbi:hypothetical protein VNO77_41735 [Canavalia gladiata]|uniref:Uncharacterized protein n=1 Tax=Canavalia gladiata TaxID=3824 RepID=A0AAN9K0C6_CANGL